ncbi:MAG: BASS family bile acid:Na+ symporter [Verrucomicrobiales bacterium]|jgi:BASS family bile acid:Na+ symporter
MLASIIVSVILPLVLAFIMFSLGLGLRLADFARVFKYPKVFTIGLLNQLILLPLVAYGIVLTFRLSPELAIGTMILAFSPGGVTSNLLARLAKGNAPVSISLTAVVSLLSVITVPILVGLTFKHFQGDATQEIDVTMLGVKMFLLTAVPVGLGMLLTAKTSGFVEKASKVISNIAMGLFMLVIIAAIAANWKTLSSNLPTLGPALVLLNILLLGLGLLTAKLSKLSFGDATTVAIESGVQNGTVAITIGLIAIGAEGLPPITVPAAVYGVTMYFITLPFVFWRRRCG